MHWSHNDNWMVTGDHSGFVKYWQSNMNNVRMFQAHKEAVRGIRYIIDNYKSSKIINIILKIYALALLLSHLLNDIKNRRMQLVIYIIIVFDFI